MLQANNVNTHRDFAFGLLERDYRDLARNPLSSKRIWRLRARLSRNYCRPRASGQKYGKPTKSVKPISVRYGPVGRARRLSVFEPSERGFAGV